MIRVTSENALEQRVELEKEVDADLDEFARSFQSMGNDRLSRPERAILKTYLAWKLGIASAGT